MKLNYQVDIHALFQFQERDNLSKCQCGSQNLKFGQVQMGMMKLNLGFQNTMIPGSDDRAKDINIGLSLIREVSSFL